MSSNNTVRDFEHDERVQLHPATDLWMRGDRFGTVHTIGAFYVWVLLDRTGRVVKVRPCDLLHME